MNMMGVNDVPAYRHVPKSEMKEALCNYIFQTRGVVVQKIWSVEEPKPQCKHACSRFGISLLNVEFFDYAGIRIPFWFCSYCGTLRVWLDYD